MSKHKLNRPFDPSKPVLVRTSATGPTSDVGKQTSSRNATKHGCCSIDTLILDSESEEDFRSLESAWFRSYQPQDPAEVHLVRQLAHADWFLQRSIRTLARVEAGYFEQVPDPAHWDDSQHHTIARFTRYLTTHTNIVLKRRKAVEEYRKNRAAEVIRAQAGRHKDEVRDTARVKLEIYKEKNKPRQTWAEELQDMKAEAERLGFRKPDRPNL